MDFGVNQLIGSVFAIHGLFFLLVDLFVFLMTFTKRKESYSQGAFSSFALVVIVLQIVALFVIAVEHGMLECKFPVLYFLYLMIVALPVAASYFCCRWMVRLFSLSADSWSVQKKILAAIPMIVYVLMALVSQKTHWVFYLDENGGYQRGNMFFLQIAAPYGYLLGVCGLIVRSILKKQKMTNARSCKYIALFFVPPVVGTLVQTFLNLNGCFSELGVSAGLILVYIGMYMGDAEEHRRLKDLADFNEKLQMMNKQLRSTMMKGELQAKTVAETIHGGFKIGKMDKYYTFTYISEQLANMLGYTVPEMMEISGGSMAGLVDIEEAKRVIPDGLAQAARGEVYTMNYKMRCKDGSWKHVQERGRVIKAEGSEDETWSVIVDVDEMVQVEEALKRVEKSRKELAEYNDIISNAGLGVWFVTITPGKPNQLYGNEKFYELIGIDGDSMSREDLHELFANSIAPEDVPTFGAAIEKMKTGQFAETLYRWKHPTKGYLYNRCGGTGVQLPDGSFCLSGYHGDATEIVMNEKKQEALLKDALVAAEESNRAKTAFLNNMSHDIRTPMNAILGFATLMEKDCDHPEKVKEYLKKLKGSGDFLLSLINNVLEMARIESGKADLNEQPTYLAGNTDATMDIFDTALKDRNLKLTSSMSVQHQYVYCDMVKVREVIINLISNAIKYSKVNGRIDTFMTEIPCSREGYAAYEFVVQDDGIGMSKEYMPHVFDSFVRERNFTESKIVGTGLGLPIVKKLVELMGGAITVESEEGKGSKFTFVLEHRLCTEEEFNKAHGEVESVNVDLKGKRILLAEDNDLNAEIAITLLVDAGFKVERAVDGVVCVDMLKESSAGYYDFILMDIQMPNMDGYEATRVIRNLQDETLKNIPIVAMTANAFDEDRRSALKAGMNGHVAKPINMNTLIKAVSEALT